MRKKQATLKATPKPSKKPSQSEIQDYAQRSLQRWIKKLSLTPALRKRVGLKRGHDFYAEVTVCSNQRMKALNEQYRGADYATDILSFVADPFFQAQGILGELLICAPVLIRQANEVGHSWKKEADVLIVHGVLHLLNFDHEVDAKAATQMKKWEKKLLGSQIKSSLIERVSEMSG